VGRSSEEIGTEGQGLGWGVAWASALARALLSASVDLEVVVSGREWERMGNQ
jgi:hypothetical protein